MSLQAGWRENSVAAVLMAEAGVDGRAGMECVAEVWRNRTRRDVMSLLNSNVFVSLRGTTPDRLYRYFHQENPKLTQVALEVASCLLTNSSRLPSRVNGATHFCHVSSRPWWSKRMKRVAVVGRHAFYKE